MYIDMFSTVYRDGGGGEVRVVQGYRYYW